MQKNHISFLFVFLIHFLFSSFSIYAQNTSDTSNVHEITIYAMPTLKPIKWDNPAILYRTMRQCYLKTMFVKDNYLLGHVAVKIKSTILPKPILIAMTSSYPEEKAKLVLKDKIGFGIVGAAISGHIESEKELERKLNVYAKRNKLACIVYRVNETALRRMLAFIETYSTRFDEKYAPCNFYGGAFWPRYHKEGSGCANFGMALLDVANILNQKHDAWRKTVKVPIKLVGGIYNKNKKIYSDSIYNTKNWYVGNGKINVDYVEYDTYDPNLMYDWVTRTQKYTIEASYPIKYAVPVYYEDCRNVFVSDEEPLFVDRKNPNLFIDFFFKSLNH